MHMVKEFSPTGPNLKRLSVVFYVVSKREGSTAIGIVDTISPVDLAEKCCNH